MVNDFAYSFLRVAAGFCIGSVVGVGLGLITGRNQRIADLFTPIVQLFRPLPPVAIIPLVIIWLGIGETAKISSISFGVFFPVWLNTHIGSGRIPQQLLWSASTLSRSAKTIFWRVTLPATLPFIVAGLRAGIALAFVMVFVSELAGASVGVGYQISTSYLAYRIDRMMAGLLVLGLSGAFADYGLSAFVNWKYPWLPYLGVK